MAYAGLHEQQATGDSRMQGTTSQGVGCSGCGRRRGVTWGGGSAAARARGRCEAGREEHPRGKAGRKMWRSAGVASDVTHTHTAGAPTCSGSSMWVTHWCGEARKP